MKKEVSKKKSVKKDLTKQDMVLLGTFIALIILVSALGLYAMNIEKIAKANSTADITVPVLEEQSESEISVEISDMQKGDTREYTLVVANYKDDKVLDKVLSYNIDITPSETANVKVYKNESSTNLLTNDDLSIENNKFKAGKKTEDTYKIIIEVTAAPQAHEKITIKISS